jgi:hypothetical protein
MGETVSGISRAKDHTALEERACRKEQSNFSARQERSSAMQVNRNTSLEALSRRKTGIKPLPAVAFYTVLTVDKTSALK